MTLKRLMWLGLLSMGLVLPVYAQSIYGYVEKVALSDDLLVKAKLDTGALSASLSAQHIHYFSKAGKRYVRFDIPGLGKKMTLTRPLLKFVKIKARTGEKKQGIFDFAIKRPLVPMTLTLGGVTKTIDVNLANRSRFNYPLLLGRNALIAFDAVVDPAKAFTAPSKG